MSFIQKKSFFLLIVCLILAFCFTASAEEPSTPHLVSEPPLIAEPETASAEVQLPVESTQTPSSETEPTPDVPLTEDAEESEESEASETAENTEAAKETPAASEAPASEPEVTPAPQATETTSPKPSATPAVSAAPADEEKPFFFTCGYVHAGSETPVYKTRNSSEDNLLFALPRSATLYATHRYGNGDRLDWVRVLIYADVENSGAIVYEGYIFADYLEAIPADKLESEEKELRSGTYTEAEGGILGLITTKKATAKENPTAEPVTEVTVEPTVEPTEIPTPELTEEPTIQPTAEPTAEPVKSPSVSIVTHAATPVHIGDTVTLEAIPEGFDHEPVYLWEYRLPGDDCWYPFEGETNRTFTFVVNQYNYECSWRVTAN